MIEIIWRLLIVASAIFGVRTCAFVYAAFVCIRDAGCNDIFSLERYHDYLKSVDKKTFWTKARPLFPAWFRILFLWKL